jgi:hypothetical protein
VWLDRFGAGGQLGSQGVSEPRSVGFPKGAARLIPGMYIICSPHGQLSIYDSALVGRQRPVGCSGRDPGPAQSAEACSCLLRVDPCPFRLIISRLAGCSGRDSEMNLLRFEGCSHEIHSFWFVHPSHPPLLLRRIMHHVFQGSGEGREKKERI